MKKMGCIKKYGFLALWAMVVSTQACNPPSSRTSTKSQGNNTSTTPAAADAQGTLDPNSLPESTPQEIAQSIRRLDTERLKLNRINEKIHSFLKGENSSSCALSLPIHTLKITMEGVIDGNSKLKIQDPTQHIPGFENSALKWYLGEDRFHSLSVIARAYSSFAQPYIKTWDPIYHVRDIYKINVIQSGDLFGAGKTWTLNKLTITATEKNIEIWKKENLNETFKAGHQWTISHENLKTNQAYQNMLQHKDCDL